MILRIFSIVCLLIPAVTLADVDFLSDYSKLSKPSDGTEDLMYVAPGAFERLAEYDKIFVDQPEIFLSPSSKYKGLKPDDMKIVVDLFRDALTTELGSSYEIVDQPGLGVLYIRLALVDLHLKKAKRGLLSYTPGGALIHAAKTAMQNDVTKKISLIEVTIEGEMIDSSTGEVLAAIIEHRGQAKDKKSKTKEEASSWAEINSLLQSYATRIKCRLDNARVSEDQQVQCRS